MVVARRITERPVAGGEKWSAAFGPTDGARVVLRALRAATTAAAALGVATLAGGRGAPAAFVVAAGLLCATVGAQWLAGGSEAVAFQGGVIAHRRRRLFREERRSVAVLDVRRIRPPAGHGRRADTAGLRIETADDVWAIGQGIAWAEANELAESLGRHLRLFERDVLAAEAIRLDATRSAAPPRPAQALPVAVLRLRNPPPR